MGKIDFERKTKETSSGGATTDRETRFQVRWSQGPAREAVPIAEAKRRLTTLAEISAIIWPPIMVLIMVWPGISGLLHPVLVGLIRLVLVYLGHWLKG